MLSDILPTGFECGVLNGKISPGSAVAIVGAGPVGLATLLTAQFYSPAEIIMIDVDDKVTGRRDDGARDWLESGLYPKGNARTWAELGPSRIRPLLVVSAMVYGKRSSAALLIGS
ncbi:MULTISPECIES: hypothetical protein [Bradyrhizobium]|uniref:Uncharacterized protein n=1 Tax=Bradyrhizobium quebecense TaxID=2748629 RepID=A0ACD3VLK4_9BRAD|nr:hypothetical protein J4P68_0024285 [Bradyrhizobium quebecense]